MCNYFVHMETFYTLIKWQNQHNTLSSEFIINAESNWLNCIERGNITSYDILQSMLW